MYIDIKEYFIALFDLSTMHVLTLSGRNKSLTEIVYSDVVLMLQYFIYLSVCV